MPDRQIRVEGHTDNSNVGSKTKLVNSNWELSALRSVNVVKYLISAGNVSSGRLAAIGYGQERPIAGTVTKQNAEQRSKNRRVDIIVLSKRESNKEK